MVLNERILVPLPKVMAEAPRDKCGNFSPFSIPVLQQQNLARERSRLPASSLFAGQGKVCRCL